MKSITKLQFITIILLMLFVAWEIYIKRWELSLPSDDPAIRVDLVIFIPILLGFSIASILQIKNKGLKKVLSLVVVIIAVIFFFTGCQNSDPKHLSTKNNTAVIINAKQEFLDFLSVSSGKPFGQKKQLWLDKIETLAPKFYESNIWGAKYAPDDWRQNRDGYLKDMFLEYST